MVTYILSLTLPTRTHICSEKRLFFDPDYKLRFFAGFNIHSLMRNFPYTCVLSLPFLPSVSSLFLFSLLSSLFFSLCLSSPNSFFLFFLILVHLVIHTCSIKHTRITQSSIYTYQATHLRTRTHNHKYNLTFMHAHTYTHTHVYTNHAYIHTHTHTRTYITHVHTHHMHARTRTYSHTHTYYVHDTFCTSKLFHKNLTHNSYTHTYAYTRSRTRTNISTRARTHTHSHTHAYTSIPSCTPIDM